MNLNGKSTYSFQASDKPSDKDKQYYMTVEYANSEEDKKSVKKFYSKYLKGTEKAKPKKIGGGIQLLVSAAAVDIQSLRKAYAIMQEIYVVSGARVTKVEREAMKKAPQKAVASKVEAPPQEP